MITIVHKQSASRLVQVHVCDNATPGTWGSHQLLVYEYMLQEENDQWTQARFNMRYLKDMQLSYGPLWCVYCGKEELVIYGFQEKHSKHNMATADHVIPRSKAPHLALDRRNLRVACWHCNVKKGSEDWPEKFPYD